MKYFTENQELKVVITGGTYSATSDDKLGIMTTLNFRCLSQVQMSHLNQENALEVIVHNYISILV